MKLVKGLVVTGILFSSVLGSVNVGNITAMAAADTGDTSSSSSQGSIEGEANQTIQVSYIDKDGKVITDSRLKTQISKDKANENIQISDLGTNLADEYKVSSSEVKDGKFVVTLLKIENESVNLDVKYIIDGQSVTDSQLQNSISVKKDQNGNIVVNESNFESDKFKDYTFVTKDNFIVDSDKKTVTVKLEKKVKSDVNVIFLDSNNKEVKTKKKTVLQNRDIKELVDSKDVVAPKGYTLNPNQKAVVVGKKVGDETEYFVKMHVTKQKSSNHILKTYIQIDFVDKSNKDKVGVLRVTGRVGDTKKVDLPKGYKIATKDGDVVKFDKKNKAIEIYVVKDNPVTTETVKITNRYSTIATHNGETAYLYSQDGKMIKNRALAGGSEWASDKTMVLKGVTYYRVSTNEWAKAENVFEYTANNGVVNTAAGQYKSLFNSKGQKSSNRALAANTSWRTDKFATINGQKMYRVATNEWVKATDIK